MRCDTNLTASILRDTEAGKLLWLAVLLFVFCNTNQLLAAPIGIGPGSVVTITHDPLPGEVTPRSVTITPPQLALNRPASIPFQSHSSGADSSSGGGTAIPAFRSTSVGPLILGGTGVSQLDPPPDVAASTLRIDFTIDYLFDAAGLPLPWFHAAYFPLTSFAEPGDIVTFSATTTFFSQTLGVFIGPGVNESFVNNGLGALTRTINTIQLASASVPGNDTLTVMGSILFTANNQTGPADISLLRNGGLFAVPEPSTLYLLSAGILSLLGYRWRRWRQGV